MKVEENIPLAPLTTLGIGGEARYFVRATTEEEVAEAVRWARDNSLPLFILGGGSNVLISDAGFDGLVLQIALRGMRSAERGERNEECLETFAGEDWDPFVEYCVRNDLTGVECLSGIPGFVGGTPVQNVGAYGQEVSETIVEVRVFDRASDEFVNLSNADCGFSYRTSIFNTTMRNRFIVLAVTYRLIRGGPPKIEYPELKKSISSYSPSLAEVRDQVLKIRRAKSMVIDPADPNSRSAGSFFKNPIVESDKLEALRNGHPGLPSFEFGSRFKIPAAWLIENAGFGKGFVSGNAGISSQHTLALINRGGATAAEMIELKESIQAAVVERFGISLEQEPVFVGS